MFPRPVTISLDGKYSDDAILEMDVKMGNVSDGKEMKHTELSYT